jgi:predicted dehydrogenase
MVGMNQRFRYDAKMMKSYILQGEIGEPFFAKAGWQQKKHGKQWRQEIDKSGGGVLVDLGISIIDSLMWFFDFAKVRSVNAAVFHHLTKTVEDVCAGSIYFDNGSLAAFDVSWTLFSSVNNFYFDIHGNSGSLKINPLQLFKSTGDKFEPVYSESVKTNLGIYRRSYESELKHFALMLRNHAPALSTIEESVKIMEIVEALYLSARERHEVYL